MKEVNPQETSRAYDFEMLMNAPMPDFRLIFTRRDTLSVLKNVTIGMGAFIHISKAYARLVSWGFTSFILNAIFI